MSLDPSIDPSRNRALDQALAISHPALEIQALVKTFDQPAVDDLSLTIAPGQIYALLGPNGAGKTTTLRMVSGLLKPDSGAISVCGIDVLANPVEAKRVTAWVPDEPLVYDKLSPREYLTFVAGLWQIDAAEAGRRAADLIAWLGLAAHADARCQGFSKGMRQKVALAGALIHDPKLIILDEPLTGLDAGSARQVKSVLAERVASGVTVIMTTHILDVAERMADRIGVIARGRLAAEGTLDDLRASAGQAQGSLEDIFLEVVADDAMAAEQGSGSELAA
ncbi:MAG: ABC transporter ATP-binding protein [Pseudomonadota bacterium]